MDRFVKLMATAFVVVVLSGLVLLALGFFIWAIRVVFGL